VSGHQHDEGHTIAGWAGFGIGTVGVAGAGVGVCVGSALALWGGLGVVLVGLLATWVLHLAGWGKPPGRRPVDEWGWRVRDAGAREGHPACVGCRLVGRGRTAVGAEVAAVSGEVAAVSGEAAVEPVA
jgi:hypothetical protein